MNVIDENSIEDVLKDQIKEYEEPAKVHEEPSTLDEQAPVQKAATEHVPHVGETLSIKPHSHDLSDEDREAARQLGGGATIGQNLNDIADIREGWVPIDRSLLGERSMFYPESWQFRVRPATVEAIRNWSTIDDTNINVVDDVFNEILKSCLSIVTPNGPLPWSNVRSWDRFFFLLLIREYTFAHGERKIEYEEDCPNCENAVKFNLTSNALMYELPDPEVMHYFDPSSQTWIIDPAEFDMEGYPTITLYLPTLEKDANIKAWVITRAQDKKKVDSVFIKFLAWMAPKISKDETIAARQIKEYEMKFKSLDMNMFSLMNDIINNVTVTPLNKLKTVCPVCGEEFTADVRFQNGVSDLFNVSSGHKKFGKK